MSASLKLSDLARLGGTARRQARAALAGAGTPPKAGRGHKFGAVRTTVGGHTFPSKAEARRYVQLMAMQRAGVIADLELQPMFPITAGGKVVAKYRADFRYRVVATGAVVIEDVKSKATRTTAYLLRKKLVEALHNIVIVEVTS